ncbi:MAG: hypothetical protein AAF620_14170 [Bacteroidota bacterium]
MTSEEIAKTVWKQCNSIEKYALTRQINQLIKEEMDQLLDDPFIAAIFTNEGYYLAETPKMNYKIFRGVISEIPDNWSVMMPGEGNRDIYDNKGVLRKKFWKLPALRTKYDIELIK